MNLPESNANSREQTTKSEARSKHFEVISYEFDARPLQTWSSHVCSHTCSTCLTKSMVLGALGAGGIESG